MQGFIFQSLFLGVGLAMDASCVSMANGLTYKKMSKKQILFIAFMFGLFQAVMPLIGFTLGSFFSDFVSRFTPYIALGLLGYLGIKMIIDGLKGEKDEDKEEKLTFKLILIQAFATAIDALSVGLIMVGYTFLELVISISLIGLTTFILSIIGVYIGKKFGMLLKNKAIILGGIILIIIGLKIFIEAF